MMVRIQCGIRPDTYNVIINNNFVCVCVSSEGSGAYYYYNDKTGESKWEKPSELEAY